MKFEKWGLRVRIGADASEEALRELKNGKQGDGSHCRLFYRTVDRYDFMTPEQREEVRVRELQKCKARDLERISRPSSKEGREIYWSKVAWWEMPFELWESVCLWWRGDEVYYHKDGFRHLTHYVIRKKGKGKGREPSISIILGAIWLYVRQSTRLASSFNKRQFHLNSAPALSFSIKRTGRNTGLFKA